MILIRKLQVLQKNCFSCIIPHFPITKSYTVHPQSLTTVTEPEKCMEFFQFRISEIPGGLHFQVNHSGCVFSCFQLFPPPKKKRKNSPHIRWPPWPPWRLRGGFRRQRASPSCGKFSTANKPAGKIPSREYPTCGKEENDLQKCLVKAAYVWFPPRVRHWF